MGSILCKFCFLIVSYLTLLGELGLKYQELEEAMNNSNSPNRAKYETIRKQNLHKMEPIPVCKIPN